MADLNQPAYGPYERQRLLRILVDLCHSRKDLNWSTMHGAISEFQGTEFSRQSLYRLKDPDKYGRLSDATVDIIVRWVEDTFDKAIRERLKPQAIFGEMGKTSRDYYFHLSAENVLDDWDEQLLKRFAGVYLCQPAWDKNSLLPMPALREWFRDYKSVERFERKGRSLDIKNYISERSILILQYNEAFYYHAAEFPLSALFPDEFETGCFRMVYEGVGVVSSNSIQVQLRDCLTRVPKTHSILIYPKTNYDTINPAVRPFIKDNRVHGFNFFVPPGAEGIKADWENLTEMEVAHMRREYAQSLEDKMRYSGPVQFALTPLPSLQSAISMTFARDYVFHPKPTDFLRHQNLHFLRPDLENTEMLKKVIDNPLAMGELL